MRWLPNERVSNASLKFKAADGKATKKLSGLLKLPRPVHVISTSVWDCVTKISGSRSKPKNITSKRCVAPFDFTRLSDIRTLPHANWRGDHPVTSKQRDRRRQVRVTHAFTTTVDETRRIRLATESLSLYSSWFVTDSSKFCMNAVRERPQEAKNRCRNLCVSKGSLLVSSEQLAAHCSRCVVREWCSAFNIVGEHINLRIIFSYRLLLYQRRVLCQICLNQKLETSDDCDIRLNALTDVINFDRTSNAIWRQAASRDSELRKIGLVSHRIVS